MENEKNNAYTATTPREKGERFFVIDLLTHGRVTTGLITRDGETKWLGLDWPLAHAYEFKGSLEDIREFTDAYEDQEDEPERERVFAEDWKKFIGTNAVATGNVIRFVPHRDACQDALARGVITSAEFERATLEDPDETYCATTDALRADLAVPLTPDEKLDALDDVRFEIMRAHYPEDELEMMCVEAKHRLLGRVLARAE